MARPLSDAGAQQRESLGPAEEKLAPEQGDGRFTRKKMSPLAPQDRGAARHGAAHRGDPDHVQRVRHERGA